MSQWFSWFRDKFLRSGDLGEHLSLRYSESIRINHFALLKNRGNQVQMIMKTKAFVRVCALALLVTFGVTGTSEIASRDRILTPVDATQVAAVRGTAHPLAQTRFDQGRTDPMRPITATITFRLSPAQQADLKLLLKQQQDPTAPNYHKWLTPEQYAGRFGMTKNDLAKVSSWLQSQGLTVESIARNHNEITFSGSVGPVEYALKTELHNYLINGEQHFANATNVSFPTAFSSQVLDVRGLNDFHPKPRVHPVPEFTSSISGNHFVIPGDFATIYDIPANCGSGACDGAGVSIAVIGQTTISTTDLDNFRSASGLPATSSTNFIQTIVPGSGTGTLCSGDESEADLDLEWSEGIAKNSTIHYVYAGVGTGNCTTRTANVFDALQYAITQNIGRVISISYGNCEANLGSSFVLTMQQWAQEANVQGQTISGPAGDSGAADCEDPSATVATTGLAVDVPAAIPEVTGVGGSEFTLDAGTCPPNNTCGAGGALPDSPYWSGATTTNSGATALEYIPEKTWNDSSASGIAAGGGGASTIFSKPSWQSGTGVPADGARDVPDIALNASNTHDPYLICSPGSCTSGFRDSSNNLDAVGGTSAGAPTFAGIVALLNQATGSNGLGNVNPMLYALAASNANAFHDISSGDNKVACTSGTTNCPVGTASIGFTAGPGYDEVTGLGSLDVKNLISAWLGAAPAQDFSVDGLAANASAPGQSGASTITVTALYGFNGTVDLTCAPNNASVHISCSLNPTSVNLSSNNTGTSQLSLTTTAELESPRGSHQRGLWLAMSGGIFAVTLLGSFPKRRVWLSMIVLVALLLVAVACGGGGSSSQQQQQSQGTPAGTYAITVTGTSGQTSHSATVSLTVQ